MTVAALCKLSLCIFGFTYLCEEYKFILYYPYCENLENFRYRDNS